MCKRTEWCARRGRYGRIYAWCARDRAKATCSRRAASFKLVRLGDPEWTFVFLTFPRDTPTYCVREDGFCAGRSALLQIARPGCRWRARERRGLSCTPYVVLHATSWTILWRGAGGTNIFRRKNAKICVERGRRERNRLAKVRKYALCGRVFARHEWRWCQEVATRRRNRCMRSASTAHAMETDVCASRGRRSGKREI